MGDVTLFNGRYDVLLAVCHVLSFDMTSHRPLNRKWPKTYSGEILFRVGSHVFAKAAKSLKAGEESILHDEVRIGRDSFFEVKQFLSG